MAEKLGRYEILEEIGQGGFAIVHRGRDTALDRLIAMKELRPILLNDTAWVKRFRREARTIARLDHPHIVTIHDIYDAENRLFIVMRLVDGPSLEEVIIARGPLPWPEALNIITAIIKGLDYAHTQDILHRDLKPANILLDSERGPMLTDFGLAKLAGESSTSITAGGGVVGTPHYIAPEVWEGKGTTKQSDIYALGCILYEMLLGEKIFKGETPPAVMMAHFKPLALPDTWPEGIPSDVARILRNALDNNPADRYTSAAQMVEDLESLASDEESLASLPDVAQTTNLPAAEQVSNLSPPSDVETNLNQHTGDLPPPELTPAEISSGPPEPVAAPATPIIAQAQIQPASEPVQVREAPEPAAVSPPVAVSPRHRQIRAKRRGRGCWIGLAVSVFLLLLVVVGIGSFCSSFGRSFTTALFQPVELGDTITEPLDIPVPDSANMPRLTVDFTGGELSVTPGSEDALLVGTATYNVPKLSPIVDVDDNHVHLHHSGDIGLDGYTTTGLKNTWDLELGSSPLELTINASGAEANLELGGLTLESLIISQGASNFNLAFNKRNQTRMDTLHFSGGASSATLSGLANTHAKDIIFEGGAGDYTLDFSGDLQDDIDVTIHGGLGTITVIVPEGVAAELTVGDGPMSNITVLGAWQETDQKFIIPGEGSEITITAEFGFGNLKLQSQ